MRPYYDSEPCGTVLRDLYARARKDYTQFARRLPGIAIKQFLGGTFSDSFKTADFQNVYMSISPDAGKFLYQIVRSHKPRLVVEFGSSFGISALFIGAALKDQGFGHMIGTDIEPNKVAAARANLAKAGLDQVVEIREGDALQTLKRVDESIGVLFLDGWKDLYLPVAEMLLPRMEPGSVLLADNMNTFPKHLKPFRAFIADPNRGAFISATLPMGTGLEFAVKL